MSDIKLEELVWVKGVDTTGKDKFLRGMVIQHRPCDCGSCEPPINRFLVLIADEAGMPHVEWHDEDFLMVC